MAYTVMTKMKMLALWEILKQDTDQEHPITTNEICDRLAARDIPCERKSVAVDIALLNKCGYDSYENNGLHVLKFRGNKYEVIDKACYSRSNGNNEYYGTSHADSRLCLL